MQVIVIVEVIVIEIISFFFFFSSCCSPFLPFRICIWSVLSETQISNVQLDLEVGSYH